MPTNSRHHRRSIRLKGYDYTQPGAYFITICTYQKTCLFGDIVSGEMHLNYFGNVASHELKRLPQRFLYLLIDEAIIMPNHLHAIWQIQEGRDVAAQSLNQIPNLTRHALLPYNLAQGTEMG